MERTAAGALRFLRPDGGELPQAPDSRSPDAEIANGADSPEVLQRWLSDTAADVDWTDRFPEWDGSRLDLEWAIRTLWSPSDPMRESEANQSSRNFPARRAIVRCVRIVQGPTRDSMAARSRGDSRMPPDGSQ